MPFFNLFSSSEEQEIGDLVPKFPAVLKRAKVDWEKFKAGVGAKAFTRDQYDEALGWFSNFPRLWDTIRPNFDQTQTIAAGQAMSSRRQAVLEDADGFVKRLRTAPEVQNLGFAVTTIVVAGILVAAIFGTAGAVWAVGFVKKQNNVSRMIDLVTEKKLPASVLQKAVAAGSAGPGFFGGVTDLMKYGLIVAGVVFAWPLLKQVRGARA